MTQTQSRIERRYRGWFIALLVIYATCLLLEGFSPKYGLLKRAMVGAHFYEHAMPQLKELQPPISPLHGYDGQFYLQMAFDPTLRDPNLAPAVDTIGYRGQRIGLSALAYALGFGKPAVVAQLYCGLNIVFWSILLVLVVRYIGIDSMEQRCMVLVTMFTAGVVVSIWRALSDLPAVSLGLLAVAIQQSNLSKVARGGSMIAAAASSMLCKETGVLSLPSLVSFRNRRSFFVSAICAAIAMLPLIAWFVYVKSNIGSGSSGNQNFTYPLYGFIQKLSVALSNAWTEFPSIHIDEIIAPISVMLQVAYYFYRRDWKNEIWRFGIGFAVLALFLAQPVWEAQSAFSRVLLPLTIAFNIQLAAEFRRRRDAKQSNRSTFIWFWVGNLGLLDRALPVLVIWFIAEKVVARKISKSAEFSPDSVTT
jgi:hypothetical protein